MKIALVQFTTGSDPVDNCNRLREMLDGQGGDLICLPEVVNLISPNRDQQITAAGDQSMLRMLQTHAAQNKQWIHIGSMAVQDGARLANRSFLIDDQGEIRAQYDKIYLFDVEISPTEKFHESATYSSGRRAVVVETPLAQMGLSICYDLRFPQLYRDLAQAGAQVIFVPAAFAMTTGQAHWHVLLRARAIETGCYIVAAAQTGAHPGSSRQSYGHSLVVDPWGEIIMDAGTDQGVFPITLDLAKVDQARAKVPSLQHDQPYTLDIIT